MCLKSSLVVDTYFDVDSDTACMYPFIKWLRHEHKGIMAYKMPSPEVPKDECILYGVTPECACLNQYSIPVAQIIHINMLLHNGQGDYC